MNRKDSDRYEILRSLTTSGVSGQGLEEASREALVRVSDLIGLGAIALYLWNKSGKSVLKVFHANSSELAERLAALEEGLFADLRQNRDLVSAYMSFGGADPCHSFTLPLRRQDEVFGAVIGLETGEHRRMVSEDAFLDGLTAAIALHAIAGGLVGDLPKAAIDKERLAATIETAITVNHEINNPLTAILGNVQLLLLHRDDLDDDLRNKLVVIESSASRIKDVTQKLLKLTSARTTDYADGTSMIDLSDPDDPPAPPPRPKT